MLPAVTLTENIYVEHKHTNLSVRTHVPSSRSFERADIIVDTKIDAPAVVGGLSNTRSNTHAH